MAGAPSATLGVSSDVGPSCNDLGRIGGSEIAAASYSLDETDIKLANAVWAELSGKALLDTVNGAFTDVSQWRRNIFFLPTGHPGENFIDLDIFISLADPSHFAEYHFAEFSLGVILLNNFSAK